jgi:carbamoyltransferase
VKVLGVNAVFHDPAAALVIDGKIIAAAEEERFSRRKHGKRPVPFSTWELPEQSAAWCLSEGQVSARDLDAIAYSYDPSLAGLPSGEITTNGWEPLRSLFVRRAPRFLTAALPGLNPDKVVFVAHHIAHAASACMLAPYPSSAVMVLDGRGENASYLAAHWQNANLEVLATQALPHSIGLMYEAVTEHLGFLRSSDEFKVMALAAYGRPRWGELMRDVVRTDGMGGFALFPIDWCELTQPRGERGWSQAHADLAASVQQRVEEILLELAEWLQGETGERVLTMAGGVALNCVANARLAAQKIFHDIWIQPAAGDAGTALGAALYVATMLGDRVEPMRTAALGRQWDDIELEDWLRRARVTYERPDDIARASAELIAADGIVGWFQGRSEFGPRALGHRSLLANPRRAENLVRLNDIKGREHFRPVAPMVSLSRSAEIFEGMLPSPFMLFTHRVRANWRERIPAVVHVDGSARAQTVDPADEILVARLLHHVEELTGVPVVVNTSLNTAGRPMVDDPRDALECLGSTPLDALAIGPFLVRKAA